VVQQQSRGEGYLLQQSRGEEGCYERVTCSTGVCKGGECLMLRKKGVLAVLEADKQQWLCIHLCP
jgi:hypothetical protein